MHPDGPSIVQGGTGQTLEETATSHIVVQMNSIEHRALDAGPARNEARQCRRVLFPWRGKLFFMSCGNSLKCFEFGTDSNRAKTDGRKQFSAEELLPMSPLPHSTFALVAA